MGGGLADWTEVGASREQPVDLSGKHTLIEAKLAFDPVVNCDIHIYTGEITLVVIL